jgi:hypothetical protein
MKTILDAATRAEVRARINALQESSRPQWGKMNVSQMMKHCAQWDEMAQGKKKYKQSWLGKLFGRMALKTMMKDEPMKRNLPTVPSFIVNETVDFANEKQKWIALIGGYEDMPNEELVHPFFGRLSKEAAGFMAYKHMDHHLRQFNC